MEPETNYSAIEIVNKFLDLISDISQKVITGTSSNHHDCVDWTPRYISISVPDIWEWVLTCSPLNPNLSSLMARTASLRSATISADVTCSILWVFHTFDMGVSIFDSGYFLMRFTRAAHCRTGQRIICSEANCVTVSFILSLFYHSKVIETQFAYPR